MNDQWIDMVWLACNGLLTVASLMCLGKLIHRGTVHLLTRLCYTVTPVGSAITIAGYLHDRVHAIYLGEILEVLGMLIISIRIYYYLSHHEGNGRHGAYVGHERRRATEGQILRGARGARR